MISTHKHKAFSFALAALFFFGSALTIAVPFISRADVGLLPDCATTDPTKPGYKTDCGFKDLQQGTQNVISAFIDFSILFTGAIWAYWAVKLVMLNYSANPNAMTELRDAIIGDLKLIGGLLIMFAAVKVAVMFVISNNIDITPFIKF